MSPNPRFESPFPDLPPTHASPRAFQRTGETLKARKDAFTLGLESGVGAAGNVIGSGVGLAGNVVGTGVGAAGNVIGTGVKGVGAAGNVLGSGVGAAAGVVGNVLPFGGGSKQGENGVEGGEATTP
jgi:hypothetical protein